MTTDKFWKEYRVNELAISNRYNELDELKARELRNAAYNKHKEHSSRLNTEATAILSEIADIKARQKKIIDCINALPDCFDREVARMRMVLGETLEEVAEKTNYSVSQIQRKSKAIQKIMKKMLYGDM